MAKLTKKSSRSSITKKRTIHPSPLLLTLAVLAIIAGIIYTYRMFLNTATPLQIAEIGNSSASVSLSLASSLTSIEIGQEMTIQLRFDSPTRKFKGGNIELNYDPNLIEIVSVTRNPDFPTELLPLTTTSGSSEFSYGTSLSTTAGILGNGSLASIRVKGKAAGIANITFGQKTFAGTSSDFGNDLKEVTNLSLTIEDPNASSNPSSTPSSDPSATPSDSANPTATPSTAASATPTPDKPSSPSNLRYNCYSNGTRVTLRWNEVSNTTSYQTFFDEKDGSNDTTANSSRAEIDLDIKNNTTYSWSQYAVNNGVKSDATTLDNIKCNSDTSNSNTSTSTPTPTPTAAPTKKPNVITQAVQTITKKTPTPTPKASPSPSLSPSPLMSPGSLSDIFGTVSPTPIPTTNEKLSLWEMIVRGWQLIVEKVISTLE